MKTLIVCGGDLSAEDMLLFRPLSDQADFIIAADKGCDILLETGIIPDLAVGDFDSSRVPEKTRKELRTIVYPAEKDYSDTEAALYESLLTLEYICICKNHIHLHLIYTKCPGICAYITYAGHIHIP